MNTRVHRVALVVIAWVVLSIAPGRALAQIVDPTLWTTDGSVDAIARDGNTLYIGGAFTYVGPNTGAFVSLDRVTGTPRAHWPRVNGTVYAAAPDDSGGCYIGGSFTSVAGVPRLNLAHIRADATLDGWNPGADQSVDALAVSGGTVYAGGAFSSIGGQTRNRIAALDRTSGLATGWNPNVSDVESNGAVFALAVSGSTVYAGGVFSSIGGQARKGIAAIDAVSGIATSWNPNPNGGINALVVSGSIVYVGGGFSVIGTHSRNNIAALDATNGLATSWNPNANSGSPFTGSVLALALSGSTVYAGGEFTNIGGKVRNRIAALDATSGLATAWNPFANAAVRALAVSGSTVYAAGDFTSIGSQLRRHVAALSATSGRTIGWDPGANDAAIALVVSGDAVYAGGIFSSVGGQVRDNLAALDVISGRATAWNPIADGSVDALAVSNGTVYAGGAFTRIGVQARNGIAALDASSGLAQAWNPIADGAVNAMRVSGSTLLVGGTFTNIGGQPRSHLAALDATSGLATPWNPATVGTSVEALAKSGGAVYVGGAFSSVGGQPRQNIAALDTTSGLATEWNPGANGDVYALTESGGTVFAGGFFSFVGGQVRHNLAALDASSGSATGWNPGADGYGIYSLAVSGGTVYAGGEFTGIGGQARRDIAALDAIGGLATGWDTGTGGGDARMLEASADTVFVGGSFTSIGALPTRGLARILPAPASSPVISVLSPNGGEEVNVGATHRVSWVADAPVPGVQSVDVYLSRDGATGPWELVAAGAPNTGHYDWKVTAPASAGSCYLRVDARDYAGQLGRDVTDAGFTIGSGLLGADPPREPAFALERVAPNPVRGHATLRFAVPTSCTLRLTLVDVQGRLARTVFAGVSEAGRHTASLDATGLAAGLYFVHLQGAGADLRQRIAIVK